LQLAGEDFLLHLVDERLLQTFMFHNSC
jgi:hypothetical protein